MIKVILEISSTIITLIGLIVVLIHKDDVFIFQVIFYTGLTSGVGYIICLLVHLLKQQNNRYGR